MTAPPPRPLNHDAPRPLHLRALFAFLIALVPFLNFVLLSAEHGDISTDLGSGSSALSLALDEFVAGGTGPANASAARVGGGSLRGRLQLAPSSGSVEIRVRKDAPRPVPPPPRGHSTFPFYLSCPGPSSLPRGTHRIALLYQVDLVNNWRDIVRDQLHTLAKCGLGRAASSFLVAHSDRGQGGETQAGRRELAQILAEYSANLPEGAHPKLIEAENVASAASRICDVPAGRSNETFVFHFHTLGASMYDPGWRVHPVYEESAYTRMLYYRKYVEYFTLERPSRCIGRLLGGAETCGVDLKSSVAATVNWRYGGDYWAATCSYVGTLPPPTLTNGTIPGTWIGSVPKAGGPDRHVEAHHSKNRDPTNPQMTYPEEYDSSATAFHLACRRDVLPPGDYKLAIVYHVGMLKNWRDVVEDQLETLSVCGLGRRAAEFLVTYSGGDPAELRDVLARYEGRIAAEPRLIESTRSPWEGVALNETRELCQAYERERDNMIVFYLHNKGVSRYDPGWRKMYGRRGYAQVLYWRKYMEWFTVERPSLCVNAILDGAKTCGVKYLWVRGTRHIGLYHYSGNFWAASCGFVSKLPPCTETDYYASEFWLGEGMPPDPQPPINYSNFVDLHLPTIGRRGYPNYDHLILPEEYANESLLDDTYTSFL